MLVRALSMHRSTQALGYYQCCKGGITTIARTCDLFEAPCLTTPALTATATPQPTPKPTAPATIKPSAAALLADPTCANGKMNGVRESDMFACTTCHVNNPRCKVMPIAVVSYRSDSSSQ